MGRSKQQLLSRLEQEDESMSAPNSVEVVFRFPYKSALDHACSLLSSWRHLVCVAAVAFGALWAIWAASSYFLGLQLRGWVPYAAMVAASLITGLAWIIYRYVNSVPAGFERESRAAQRIAHLQRPKWEFRLARELLRAKLRELDKELEDLLCGRAYVAVEQAMDAPAHVNWLRLRPVNLLRMVDTTKRLLISELPAALKSTPERVADARGILEVTNNIRRFYGKTVAFERESRKVEPCEHLKRIHELQFGWSDPIRDGIQQVFSILDSILAARAHQDTQLSFEIVFKPPAGVDEFCEAVGQLDEHLSELADETDDLSF
jgi:hypothetical protein